MSREVPVQWTGVQPEWSNPRDGERVKNSL